jgi:VWFA-related protein
MTFGGSSGLSGSRPFAKNTLEQAARTTVGKTSWRRQNPRGVTKRLDPAAELGPRACRRQAAEGRFAGLRRWVFAANGPVPERPDEACGDGFLTRHFRQRHRCEDAIQHLPNVAEAGWSRPDRMSAGSDVSRIHGARLVCLLIAMLTSALAAQPQLPNAPAPQRAPSFRASTRLVVHTVSVKDKAGRPVEGLSGQDFIVTEDGRPQTISFVEFQRIEEAPGAAPAAPVARSPAPERPVVPAATRAEILAPPPGDIRYRDRRLLVLYFDLTAMPPPDLMRAYAAAQKFVDTGMTPIDLVALMTFAGGAVRVKQDFTDDRARLREVIQILIFGDDQDGDGVPDPPSDIGTAFGQNDAEFNILNTDRQLSALQTAMTMLRGLPEEKSLIYFASGLRLNGTDNQAQLRATTNAAIRASVSIHPIDARGLVAQAPLGDAAQPSPGGVGIFSGRLAEAVTTGFQRSQDTLYALARDTGGKAMFDFNDLSLGIVSAAREVVSYYIIGYYSTNAARDGRFRRVRISLAGARAADLSYRQGYYADREFAKFTSADRERQLEEALMLEDPITDIPIAMEVNYFQLNRAEYFVPIAVKIPGSELALARRGGARGTRIDLIGEVKDDYGITMQNVRDRIDIRLSGSTAEQLATRPIQYETGFTLLPGKYVIKVLARDAETGRIGTYQTAFTVPNLNREEQRLPISSVVLGSQRVPLGDALYTVRQAAARAANPLVHEGLKLLPSVTRVFSRDRELFVYLQAYERGAATTQPLVAFLTFYRGDAKAFETAPVAITGGLDARSKAVPVRLSVPLERLPPGRYDCQVTVLEPDGRKAAFWRAPVVVIP